MRGNAGNDRRDESRGLRGLQLKLIARTPAWLRFARHARLTEGSSLAASRSRLESSPVLGGSVRHA